MKLSEFLKRWKGKLNDLERIFVENVFFPDYGEKGLDLLKPQVKIEKPNGEGYWNIDFVLETKENKYAIETDGLYYHASGAVTNEYFLNLQDKQNEMVHLGFLPIRFTNDLIRNSPGGCKFRLRKYLEKDREIQKIFKQTFKKILPHEIQLEVLKELEETRKNNYKKGLVVLATGLGKTYLSAFDVKRLRPKRILFIAHINEIIEKSMESFMEVIPERAKEMGLFTGKRKDKNKNFIFASIQTMSREKNLFSFGKDYFDYIIFDETHHSAAPTYKKVFEYFSPKFFLGLTATPDRTDKEDIFSYYDNNLVYEISQQDAINRGYLVDFEYHGLKDNVDYSRIYWNGFRYDLNDLNKHLMIEERDKKIISKFRETAGNKKTIGFCVSIEHANRCSEKFNDAGISAVAIHSKLESSDSNLEEKDKSKLIKNFRENKYQVAFVVDMFNEGVDFPDVECLLFLRPTESKNIFIQHMGRGLRIARGKERVLILDFIGNYRTAGLILSGLGIKSPRDLKKKRIGEKEVYYYDNGGSEVIFDEEVVDIFKRLDSQMSRDIRKELISQEWKDYVSFLSRCTEDNLYWKRGQQNQYFEVQLEAIRIIKNNPKIGEREFIKKIQEIVNLKYSGKDMTSGFRALFLAKVTGFITQNKPLKPTLAFTKVDRKIKDFSNVTRYIGELTNQLEKIYYWNNIYGTYNKYVEKEKRVSFFDFKIYPLFFVYEVILRLVEDFGYKDYFLSDIEFNSFLAISKEHSEIDNALKRIIDYREYEHKYELEKYLRRENKIDPRFYKIMRYNKYFIFNDGGIRLNLKYLSELKDKVLKFNKLLSNHNLITFSELSSENYFKLLHSNKSLLDYHKHV